MDVEHFSKGLPGMPPEGCVSTFLLVNEPLPSYYQPPGVDLNSICVVALAGHYILCQLSSAVGLTCQLGACTKKDPWTLAIRIAKVVKAQHGGVSISMCAGTLLASGYQPSASFNQSLEC
jgi:hypothetical protein